jgi:ankyrin repeat protein
MKRIVNAVFLVAFISSIGAGCQSASVSKEAAVSELREMGPISEEFLFDRVRASDSEAVKLLLEAGIDARSRVKGGITPLMLACNKGKLYVAKILIDSGADINAKNDEDVTPIIAALPARDYDIIRMLLERGANPNSQSKEGVTPLGYACSREDCRLVDLLLKNGADPNTVFEDKPVLEISRALGNSRIVLLLEKYGAKE